MTEQLSACCCRQHMTGEHSLFVRTSQHLLLLALPWGKWAREPATTVHEGLAVASFYTENACLCIAIENFDLEPSFNIWESFFPRPVIIIKIGQGWDPSHHKSLPLYRQMFSYVAWGTEIKSDKAHRPAFYSWLFLTASVVHFSTWRAVLTLHCCCGD